jgi:hypothetical protein
VLEGGGYRLQVTFGAPQPMGSATADGLRLQTGGLLR